ncbi:uncharacterized protein LOC106655378 isoform X2 [Trichogramma pretiosum]|uniref:uncharacterized protein LOC106655378 isoform X2 n=1 Tax=Trichogramma pretiosum TaxID=7493 RepID=UPI0006C96B3C|nr:uncharacterized protein LOC106655378 isoform X2 [Trichogramma pretiosum]
MSRTKDNSAELGTKDQKEKLKSFMLEEVDDCNVIVDVSDSPKTSTSPEGSPIVVAEEDYYYTMLDSPKDEEDRSSNNDDKDDDDRDKDDELESATRAPPPRRDGAAL